MCTNKVCESVLYKAKYFSYECMHYNAQQKNLPNPQVLVKARELSKEDVVRRLIRHERMERHQYQKSVRLRSRLGNARVDLRALMHAVFPGDCWCSAVISG